MSLKQLKKSNQNKDKAIVLLSGGLDSATVLAIASLQYECYTLSFDYQQRHRSELNAAAELSKNCHAKNHSVIVLDNVIFAGSALTDKGIDVPVDQPDGIPITYVPARNTVFLSHALAFAEVVGALHVFIGVNAVDYSGYPDCRQEYIDAFAMMANLATKSAIDGNKLVIDTPLIAMTKSEIIQMGTKLGIDYAKTVSCYQADMHGKACGSCDSCRFRRDGFHDAGLPDPTRYMNT